MILQIIMWQTIVFSTFYIAERLYPFKSQSTDKQWVRWWLISNIFSFVWIRYIFFGWSNIQLPSLINLNHYCLIGQGIIIYFFYSFGNYWIHRLKHANSFLWSYLHKTHHSPAQMETLVALYRHPFEIIFNTVYLILIGKLLFDASIEAIALCLAIEGCLECFHHSNIKLSKKLDWLGYFIQTPAMHLTHHQQGLHRYNYAPMIWDTVFRTVYIPESWDQELGFKDSDNHAAFFFYGLK